jgi:hypothetical protein
MNTHLTPPLGDRDHILGPADAPVTLVEYGDSLMPVEFPLQRIQRSVTDLDGGCHGGNSIV